MTEGVRIDRWLWAARFFKTRGLAKHAIDGGKVELNGHRAKPAKAVQIGDHLLITREHARLELEVRGLSERRLGAPLAAELYEETPDSISAREVAAEARRLRRADLTRPPGRPDKHARRRLSALKKTTGDDPEN